MSITRDKTQVQVDVTLQHKTKYTKPDEGESGNSLECTGTENNLLN